MTQVPRANLSLFHALQDGTHTAIRDPVESASHPFGNQSGFMAPWLHSVLEVSWYYYCGASIINAVGSSSIHNNNICAQPRFESNTRARRTTSGSGSPGEGGATGAESPGPPLDVHSFYCFILKD